MECFSGVGRQAVEAFGGMSQALRRRMRGSSGLEPGLKADALIPQPDPSGSRRVPVASLGPVGNVQPQAPVTWPKASDLVGYAGHLEGTVLGEGSTVDGGSEKGGLVQILDRLSRPQAAASPEDRAALMEVARKHARYAVQNLPVLFGLDPRAVTGWLRQDHNPETLATDFEAFLASELARHGHGPEVARWLYQQLLAAGSTCMTSLALQEGQVERFKAYAEATVNEIRQNLVVFGSDNAAAALLRTWSSGASAAQDQSRQNEKIDALRLVWRQRSGRRQPDQSTSKGETHRLQFGVGEGSLERQPRTDWTKKKTDLSSRSSSESSTTVGEGDDSLQE